VYSTSRTDIEQRMGMNHRDIRLILDFITWAKCLQKKQALVLLKPNPGGAIPLLRKEALDVTQAAPFALKQAGEGWGEQKAAANSHETHGISGIKEPYYSYMAQEGGGNLDPRKMVSAQPLALSPSLLLLRIFR
jgi:hypothetical protein